MPHLLQIESSPRGEESVSRRITGRYAEAWLAAHPGATHTVRDLALTPPPYVDSDWIAAAFSPVDAHDERAARAIAISDALVDEVEAADVLLIGAPIFNLGVPAVLKAWFDQVIRAGRTFRVGETGPEPLLTGKRAIVVRASGNDFDEAFAHWDHHTPHLRSMLGFIGITDVEVVAVHGYTPEQQDAAVEAGTARAVALAR